MQQVKAQNISDPCGPTYKIGQSLLFDGNSKLSRLWDAPPTDAKKFTVSFWTKRAETDQYQYIMSADGIDELAFANATYGDQEGSIKSVYQYGETGIGATKAGYRDAGAWYHVCYWVDFDNGTSFGDNAFFVNGVRQDKTDIANFSAGYSTKFLENGYNLQIGQRQDDPSTLRGYLAEFHCIDGLALGPEHFALENPCGAYNPIPYTGEYGNNGFYLPFEASDIGADHSGNNNDFTPSGLTADSVVADSPTNNYCTLNPLDLTGSTYSNGNLTTTGNATTTFDGIDGKWYYEKDGVGVTVDGTVGTVGAGTYNFGQGTFSGSISPGYKALCTKNLPDPLVKPEEHFKAVTYAGNGSSSRTIDTGIDAGLVWVKNRNDAYWHILNDTVRGGGLDKALSSNSTDAEGGQQPSEYGGITAIGTGGFTVGAGSVNDGGGNKSGNNYVSWNFKGGPVVTNNDGSIPSQVSANKDMGFSVVTYTGDGVAGGVGHGLGMVPSMVILKRRDGVGWSWYVQSPEIGKDNTLILNDPREVRYDPIFGQGLATASQVQVSASMPINEAGGQYVMYVFANTDMIRVGSYVGNGSADGPWISLPFNPAFVMWKRVDSLGYWIIRDIARNPFNDGTDKHLFPNESSAEDSRTDKVIDFLSNGYKVRAGSSNTDTNASGGTYIYLAISEQPFKYARGR